MKTLIYPFLLAVLFINCKSNSNLDSKTISSREVKNINKSDTVINFESDDAGKAPNRFTQSYTGKAQELNWKIADDNGNKVAAQLAKNKGNYFNLLILDNNMYGNFKMSVRIKAIAGEEDQGGGLVWRLIDNNNYYIARLNPLENNFRLYKVEDGKRKQFKNIDVNVKTGEWFTMSIEMNGNRIACSINGETKIEMTDDTFQNPGKIGLWSKADAQSYFDDLTIIPIK